MPAPWCCHAAPASNHDDPEVQPCLHHGVAMPPPPAGAIAPRCSHADPSGGSDCTTAQPCRPFRRERWHHGAAMPTPPAGAIAPRCSHPRTMGQPSLHPQRERPNRRFAVEPPTPVSWRLPARTGDCEVGEELCGGGGVAAVDQVDTCGDAGPGELAEGHAVGGYPSGSKGAARCRDPPRRAREPSRGRPSRNGLPGL
jgi:hypothetical protein